MSKQKTSRWNDYDFALDVDAAYMAGPRPSAVILLGVIFAFIVCALIFATFAEIDEVTHAEGKVIPSSKIQVIQNLEGGILQAVYVGEGELVNKGQILLQIDNSGSAANFGETQARFFSLMGTIDRLIAESEGKKLEFSPVLVAEHRQIADSQQELYQARLAELQSQQAILRQQADQRTQERAEIEGKLRQLRRSLDLTREEYNITKPLADKGIVSQTDFLQLKRQLNDLEGEISTAELALPRADSAIREANRRIEERLLAFKSEALRELAERRAEFNGLEQIMGAAEDRVSRTEVRSPVRGLVKEIKIRTIGGVIRPGEDIAEIVPVEDSLLVEGRIRPADIAFLSPDQTAMVKLTAYDFTIYGGLPAKLERISADTIRDEEGEEFYRITVRTDQNYLLRQGRKLPIMPGMVATVDVLTGERTVLNYLMKPIRRGWDRSLGER